MKDVKEEGPHFFHREVLNMLIVNCRKMFLLILSFATLVIILCFS